MPASDAELERLILVNNRTLARERELRKRVFQMEAAFIEEQRLHLADPESSLAHAVLDALPDSVFVLSASGGVTYANQAACELLGYTLEEMKTLVLTDFVAGHREWAIREFARFKHTGRYRGVATFRRKDNTTVLGEARASLAPGEVYIGIFRESPQASEG